MTISKKLCALSVSITLMTASHNLQAQASTQFDQLVVFGASFLDSGQFPDFLLDLSTGLRVTNVDPVTGLRGSALSELLSADLGLGALPPSAPIILGSRTDGTADPIDPNGNINFAVAAYRAADILESITGDSVASAGGLTSTEPGFNARLASGALNISENTLFFANIGGNDIRAQLDPQATADLAIQSIQALVDAGANHIIVLSLPKLGDFAESDNLAGGVGPERSPTGLARTAGAEAYNGFVDAGLAGINANIIRVDGATLFEEILADPSSFGFSAAIDQTSQCYNANSTGSCNEPAGLGASSGGDPGDFVFSDGLHPTQRTAQITADYIESLLRAPGQISLVSEVGLNTLIQHQTSLRTHLSSIRFEKLGEERFQIFGTYQTGETDLDGTKATPQADIDGEQLNIGFTYRLNNNFTVGGSVAYADEETDIDSIGSDFDLDGYLLSGLLAYQNDNWFGEASITYADLDIDTNRVVPLGINRRVEHGNTDADGLGITLAVGIDLIAADQWRGGPIVRVDYNDLKVDDFLESGTRSTSLGFSNMERDSLIGSVGIFAQFEHKLNDIELKYFGEFTYNTEFNDDPEELDVSLNSLAAAPSYSLNSFEPKVSAINTQLGISGTLDQNTAVYLSYTYRDSDNVFKALNIGFSYKF